MMGKSHVAFSAMLTAAGLPVANNVLGLGLGPPELAAGVLIGGVAGVLPDIDHPSSFITHGIIPGSKIFGPVGKGLGYLLCIPPRIMGVGARATMNHRGGTHSITFLVLWTLLAAPFYALTFSGLAFLLNMILTPILDIIGVHLGWNPADMMHWMFSNMKSILPLVMGSVFFGYLGHLITDSMTKVPVPWPWPFSKKRYHLLPSGMRITTDSFTENALLRPVFVVLLIGFFVWNIGIPMGQELFGKASHEIKQQTMSDKDKERKEQRDKLQREHRKQERQRR